jgi:hypothetical protein
MSGPRLRVVPIFLALLVSACSAGSVSTPAQPAIDNAPSASASDDAALSTKTALAALDSAPDAGAPTRAIVHHIATTMRADAKEPAFLINFVYAGAPIPGLPCFGCVSNISSGDDIGLPGTNNLVPSKSYWQYGLTFSDLTFVGNCKLSWSIAAGTKVLDSFSVKAKVTGGGGFYLYDFNRKDPKYSGNAVLMGKVACGKGAQTAQTSLYYE